jgi:streptogramin lyase
VLLRSGSPTNPATPPPGGVAAAPTGVVRIDPATNGMKLVSLALHPNPAPLGSTAVIAGAGFVWIRDSFNGQIYKIDPRRLSVVGTLGLTGYPASLTADQRTVWAGLSTIDPATNHITYRQTTGTCCLDVLIARGSLWAQTADSIEQLAPYTERLHRTFDIASSALTSGGGKIWALNRIQSEVTPIDDVTGRVGEAIALPGDPIAVAVGDGALWVADHSGAVERIPINGSGGVQSVRVGGVPEDIAFGAGAVWVTNCGTRSVDRIDPATVRLERAIRLPDYPTHVSVGEGAVWVLLVPPLHGWT